MKIILVIIFSIFYDCPLITTQDKNSKPVLCVIVGKIWDSNYVINVKELPERCDIFTVGVYALDPGVDVYVTAEDEKAMACLIEAKKTVYLCIGFTFAQNWGALFNSMNSNENKSSILDPLVGFLNKYKIGGIVIYSPFLLNTDIPNASQKMSDFVSSIKCNVTGLIVDLVFWPSDQITNTSSFDFTLTNNIIDHYVIEMTNLNDCDENSKIYGMSPIKNKTMNSIEKFTELVKNSTMDQSKLYTCLQASVIMPTDLVSKDDKTITTYSIYCEDPVTSCRWCANPSKLSYDQGTYAAQFYSGLHIKYLDTDDFQCSCGCGKFPVTNIIIDGWKNSEFKTCPKLD